jgi:MoaA/NifB/PqqE/SkfB family radical SAM enzyme
MKAAGIGSVRFNTVIKNDNLDQLLPIVHTAHAGRGGELLGVHRREERQRRAPARRSAASRARRGHPSCSLQASPSRGVITNSDHYLAQIPRWVRGQMTEPCPSGTTTVHVDPKGTVRRCPDFPPDVDWKQWKPYEPIACDDCFYACRGEAQAPMRWSRVLDVMARPRR